MITGAPRATISPSLTSTFTTRPGIGAVSEPLEAAPVPLPSARESWASCSVCTTTRAPLTADPRLARARLAGQGHLDLGAAHPPLRGLTRNVCAPASATSKGCPSTNTRRVPSASTKILDLVLALAHADAVPLALRHRARSLSESTDCVHGVP